jgi:hypothetical protein
MYVTQLMPLLVKGTFTPGSVTTIATLCDDWFQDEASLVSFVFRSVFFDLRARDWDQQGVPTSEFDSFVAEILPRLNAILNGSSRGPDRGSARPRTRLPRLYLIRIGCRIAPPGR